MMGPGFFAAAFAEDLFRVAAYAFGFGVVVGMAVIVCVMVVVS